MSKNMDFETEDAGIRPDPMDEEYDRMHSNTKVVYCLQCSEMSELELLNGLCDPCLDINFRKEVKDVQRYDENEYIGSWVHRRNCVSIKYGLSYDYFKWCPKCEEPKSWIDSQKPVDYDPNDTTKMWWDYEHQDANFCFECLMKGDYIEVVDYE